MTSSLDRHTDYGSESLDESDLNADPIIQFRHWLDDAERAEIFEPNAMVVSTVDADARPSSRTVLLKGVGAESFDFVTNYESRKGDDLGGNPAVSLLFPWYSLKRQVIIRGTAVRASAEVSDSYFDARPRDSRIASIASDQSRPIASRSVLEQRVRELGERYPGDSAIPRPDNWGAFRVQPSEIEFWQGRSARFHDRFVYQLDSSGVWKTSRRQP